MVEGLARQSVNGRDGSFEVTSVAAEAEPSLGHIDKGLTHFRTGEVDAHKGEAGGRCVDPFYEGPNSDLQNNTAADAPSVVDSSSVTISSKDTRKVSHKDATLVHNLIEHCLQLYMTRDEVKNALEWDSSKLDPSNVCVGIRSSAANVTPIIHTRCAMSEVAISPASVASSRQFPFTPSDILQIGIDTSTLDTTFMSDVASPVGLHLEMGNEHGNEGDSFESFCDIPWNLSLSESTDGLLIMGGNLASIFNVKVVLEVLVLDVVFLVFTS
ncbi:hypothetical protein GIB67_042680 [Kingdonia uniflora]|uniref:Uncharacterized protein n=1 Tax=Kingdonia uniflora TaxID=39325 RepID=A0A7J7P2I8_9MAGN|nr:hypothetical protein GIB67_042680 [Kingdonia uniflora]